MEEKTLISSQTLSTLWIRVSITVVGLLVMLLAMLYPSIDNYFYAVDRYNDHKHDEYCLSDPYHSGWDCDYSQFTAAEYGRNAFLIVQKNMFTNDRDWGFPAWGWSVTVFCSCLILSLIIYCWFRRYEMVVTNLRVYGRIAFGKRVDIPIDSVSAVSTIKVMKGITVASSAGRISFLMIKNVEEMYDQINNLLIERQNKAKKSDEGKLERPKSSTDELKAYKELMDLGIITQEEFDAKKKQLLGL